MEKQKAQACGVGVHFFLHYDISAFLFLVDIGQKINCFVWVHTPLLITWFLGQDSC